MLGSGGAPLGGVVGVVASEAEDVASGRRDRGEQPHPLGRVGQPPLGQLLRGGLSHEALAMLPRLAGEAP